MSRPQYKYTYFNVRARGEFIRWILAAGGLPWEDNRVDMQQWQTLKPTIPSGQLPYLVTPEGHQLSQSVAIARYVAKKAGLVPRDDFGAYKCDMIVDFIASDVMPAYMGIMPMAGPEAAAAGAEKWNKQVGPKVMGKIEAWVKESRTGYLVGDRLTWADLAVAVLINSVSMAPPLKDSLQPFPESVKFSERIMQSGKLADYIKSRPKTMVDV